MLISLPGPSDLRQVARWHDTQVTNKSRRMNTLTKKAKVFQAADMLRDVKRHQRLASLLRVYASRREQAQ